jgi:hypothetical protein
MARVKNIYNSQIRNKECPKELGVYSPSDSLSFGSWYFPIWNFLSTRLGSDRVSIVHVFSTARASTGAWHRFMMRTSTTTRSAT